MRARTLELNINIALDANLWRRLNRRVTLSKIRTVIVAFCWTIWREKNNIIFNYKYHTIGYYMRLTVHDSII